MFNSWELDSTGRRERAAFQKSPSTWPCTMPTMPILMGESGVAPIAAFAGTESKASMSRSISFIMSLFET